MRNAEVARLASGDYVIVFKLGDKDKRTRTFGSYRDANIALETWLVGGGLPF